MKLVKLSQRTAADREGRIYRLVRTTSWQDHDQYDELAWRHDGEWLHADRLRELEPDFDPEPTHPGLEIRIRLADLDDHAIEQLAVALAGEHDARR